MTVNGEPFSYASFLNLQRYTVFLIKTTSRTSKIFARKTYEPPGRAEASESVTWKGKGKCLSCGKSLMNLQVTTLI